MNNIRAYPTAATAAQTAAASPLLFGEWVCLPLIEANADRLMQLTGMTIERLKKQQHWLPLRREGSGSGTRYYLYKADLIAALEDLPQD